MDLKRNMIRNRVISKASGDAATVGLSSYSLTVGIPGKCEENNTNDTQQTQIRGGAPPKQTNFKFTECVPRSQH